MSGICTAELHAEVIALLNDVDDGEVLDELPLSLVHLAAVASPTTLDLTRRKRVMIAPQLPVAPPSLWGSAIQEYVLLTRRALRLRLPL